MDKDALMSQFPDKRAAAKFLDVSPQTLYDWLRQDPLPRNCEDRAITAFVKAGINFPEAWLIPRTGKSAQFVPAAKTTQRRKEKAK
jgi:hypothetical protein